MGGVGDMMAIASPDLHVVEFIKAGKMVVMGAQGGELLLLEFTLEGEHHREPARAGEAAEIVRTGEAWGGGYAVGLDEFAPGSTILKCAKNGEDHERCVIYDGAGTGDSFALKCL